MSGCRIVTTAIFLLFLSASGSIACAETNSDGKTDPEHYSVRRIFYPEDRLKEVIMNFMLDDPYCPIPSATFQQWMALTQNPDYGPEKTGILSSIHLTASLEGNQIVDGKGMFQFNTREGDEIQMLSLESFGLAVTSTRWSDGSEAKLGLLSRGSVGVQASSHCDTLCFDWSLGGQTNSQDNIQFDFELPAAPSIELILDIPQNMKPAMAGDCGGLIRQVTEDAQKGKENCRRWQIIFGSQNVTTIQILCDETLITPQQQIALSQTNQYEVSLRGLSLQTIFTFENVSTPLGEIFLILDAPLRPVLLEYNGEPLSWSKVAWDEDPSSDGIRIITSLPAATGNQSELRLTTFCPVTIDKLWGLPRVYLTSKRIFWMETRHQVHVLHPLKTQSIHHPELRETSPMTGLDFSDNELFAFQAYHPDAQISMNLSFETPQLLWHCGAMVEWTEQDVFSKMILDLSVTEGTVRQLDLELDPDWSLDTLYAVTPQRVGDFFAHKEKAADERSLWTIQLNQPIDPQTPLRLVINTQTSRLALASRRNPGNPQAGSPQQSAQTSFQLEDLVPIRFHNGKQGKCLLALDNKFQYNVSSTNLNPSEIMERFETMPSGIVLQLDSHSGVPVTMEPVRSTYQMNVTTRILVNRDSLDQICHFTCVPQNNSRLRQVQVQFTPSAARRKWTWSDNLRPSDTSHIQATPISEGNDDKWLIEPSVPRSTSFEFYARCTIPFQDLVEVPLPVFSNLKNVSAFVGIETRDSSGYRLHEHQLYATPVSQESSQTQQVRAFYGYSPHPGQIHSIKMEPTFSDQQIFRLSCIWSMVIQTRHDSIGNTINHVVYSLENQGIEHLKILLPRGVDTSSIYAVWIDGQRSSWHAEPQEKQILITVPLLDKKRFALIELEYFLKDNPLHTTTVIFPSVPEVNIPVISQSWIAWFSPVFHAYPESPDQKTSSFLSCLTSSSPLDAFNLTKWHHWFFEKQLRERLREVSRKIIDTMDLSPRPPAVSSSVTTAVPLRAVTWKKLLEMPQYAPKALLIDETSLSRIGIFASDTVSLESGALKAFEQNGLVWVFDDHNTLLLTSNLLMAQLRDHSSPIFGDRFYHYKGDMGLQTYLKSMPKPHRVVPITQWEKISFPDNSPWGCPESLIRFESATPLWNAYEQHWMEGASPSLVVVYKNRILACQYLSFLFVVVMTWPRRFGRFGVYFPLFLATFLAMFFLPIWWYDILYGLFWGLVCSMAFALLRISHEPVRRKARLLKRVDSRNGDTSGLSQVTRLLIFAVVIFARPLFLQANEPAMTPHSPSIPYPVYIPFHPESGDVAEYYYIPDSLYRRLYQVHHTSRFSQHNWQITSAKYQGTLINDTLFNLKATLTIEVPDQSCVFRLSPMPIRPDGVSLDKQPIQATLDPKTREHLFEISGKGTHQLELILTPKIMDDHLTKHFEIPIPPVSDSTLELTFPYEVPRVRVQDAKGRISSEGGTLVAELGPINSLIVSWPSETAGSNPLPLAVAQLLHLKALPNQVDLKTMFRFHVLKGRRSRILLTVDPRFQLSGKYRCNDVAVDHEVDAKQPTLHRIFIDPTISGEVVLQADYILNNFSGGIFSGIGQVRYPRFSIADAKTHDAWLVVSVDPSLEVVIPDPTIISRTFKDSWGKFDENFAYTFDLNHIDPAWVMQIRQKPTHFSASVDQKLLFQTQKVLSETKMQVFCAGETYHFSMTTPEKFHLDRVSVRDDKRVLRDTPRVVHTDQTVTLFFKRPLIGNIEITMNGESSLELNQPLEFPQFRPKQGDVTSQRVRLYRDFAVLVDCNLKEECYEQTEIPIAQTHQDEFFLSSTASPMYDLNILDQKQFQEATLRIKANQPKITGTQVLQVDQDLDSRKWETHLFLDLNIDRGVLDQIEISYPSELVTETPSLIDTSQLTIQPGGENQGILRLKPIQNGSLSGDQKIKVRFPMKGNNDSIQLKPIQLLNDNHVQSYVALVTQVPMKEMLWRVNHLEPVETIPGLTLDSSSSVLHKQFDYYRVKKEGYDAKINIDKNHPVVLRHDVSLFLAKNDDGYGISILDLQNHENDFCILKLPESGRLLQVKTGDMTVIPEKWDADRYRIELWPHMPVQRIEIFFAIPPSLDMASEENGVKRQIFSIPLIEDVPVEKTFWSFYMEQKNGVDYEKHFIQLTDSVGRPIVHNEHRDIALYTQGLRVFRCQMNLLRLHNDLELFQKFPPNRDAANHEFRDLTLLREKEWNQLLRETELLCSPNDQNPNQNPLVLTAYSLPSFTPNTQNEKNINSNLSRQPVTRDLMPYLQGIEQPSPDYIKQIEILYSELFPEAKSESNPEVKKNPMPHEPDTASLFFRNQTDHFLFVGGAGSQSIAEITLVSVSQQLRFYEKNTFKHLVFIVIAVCLLFTCHARFFKNLFTASPAFFAVAVGILIILLTSQKFLGWSIVLLVLLSSYFPLGRKSTR